jgi:hypothetical protein
MGKGVDAVVLTIRTIGRIIRWLGLALVRLARLTWAMILRGGRAFGASSGETKTTSVMALGFGLFGLVVSPFIGITVDDSPVSSALTMGLLGLIIGSLLGYGGVKKVRGARGGKETPPGDEV